MSATVRHRRPRPGVHRRPGDRKSTRLNSSHLVISYAVFCLKKKKKLKPVPASLRSLAEETGLSKSAVQSALELLRHRNLIERASSHATAVPTHRVLPHWRGD